MTTLVFLGDWLLILSLVMLITVGYRAYLHLPQLERQKRSALGLAVTTFFTLVLIIIAIINMVIVHPNQYLSFFVYIIALMLWITSSWWRIPRIRMHQNRPLFLLSNVFAAIGFLLLLGLLLVNVFQKFL